MKISWAEGAAIVVTAAFVALTAGMAVGEFHRTADYAVSVAVSELPAETGPAETEEVARQTVSAPEPVNVNTADAQELESLPGIGPALAERILAHREAHGAFDSPEDLLQVPGIGAGILEKIRAAITTGETDTTYTERTGDEP